MMNSQILMTSLLLLCGFVQDKPAPTRSETVVVSAGIPADQLQAEQDFRELIAKAEALAGKGDNDKALVLLAQALELIKKNVSIERWNNIVYRSRARIFLQQEKIEAAVDDFKKNIELIKFQCDREYPTCAEDLLELGSAQLRLGDNKSALATLVDASGRFNKVQDPNNRGASELVRQGYRIHEAESMLLASIARTRLGNKDSARTNIDAAIEILESVQAHPKTDEKLRSIAAQTLEFAKRLQSEIN